MNNMLAKDQPNPPKHGKVLSASTMSSSGQSSVSSQAARPYRRMSRPAAFTASRPLSQPKSPVPDRACNLLIPKAPSKSIHRRTSSSVSEPLNPARALLSYSHFLTEYERNEIAEYQKIYYIGLGAEKIKENFDDDKGFYKIVERDHLAYRYEIKGKLGNGTFGTVILCYDHKDRCEVAIKMVKNSNLYREAGELEAKLLNELNLADPGNVSCIIRMLETFDFRRHFCMVFELLSLNLYQFIEKNSFKGFRPVLVKRIAHQIVKGLKLVHANNTVHCDIKPDNIMLKHEKKSGIKIIDFSSAYKIGEHMQSYIQSRYYRAPEIILEIAYTSKIDIWSLGCVIVELVTGKVLFPAADEKELFAMIVEVIGLPCKTLVKQGRRSGRYLDNLGRFKFRGEPKSRRLEELLQGVDENLIEFVKNCIVWNPDERIDAEAALAHPWFVNSAINSGDL